MSAAACRDPLDADQFIAYWLDELEEAQAATMEEHLFACGACSSALQKLVDMMEAVRALVRRGDVSTVLTRACVVRLKAAGLRIREYRMEPRGSVNCTVAPDDDLVLAHLHAPLDDVRRLDLVFADEQGRQLARYADIGFKGNDGEVVIVPRTSDLRHYGNVTQRARLIAVEESGERIIGEYTFNHSPYRPPSD